MQRAEPKTLFCTEDQIAVDPDEKPLEIEYIAEPTLARFHASKAFVRGVMGPIGSGKSVGCMQECIRIGISQAKQHDGLLGIAYFLRQTEKNRIDHL